MTVDMTTLREGDIVHFRCGGSAVVKKTSSNDPCQLWFGSGGCALVWYATGMFSSQDHPFDIVSITPRALTPEERLAKIAEIAGHEDYQRASGLGAYSDLCKILRLARGEP